MFNAEQMENTENLVSVEGFKPIEPDRVADGIVKASPCPVIETPNDEAFYLRAQTRFTSRSATSSRTLNRSAERCFTRWGTPRAIQAETTASSAD